ncbi:MAG: DUF4258 domain-containing protein [Geitlerinemataceae cyanobacterium]
MKSLERIGLDLTQGNFDFTRHAFKRAVERNISDRELIECDSKIRLVEDYPDDKYTPSCLILGFTERQRPLHLQVSRAETANVKIITLYEPDPSCWENNSIRRDA